MSDAGEPRSRADEYRERAAEAGAKAEDLADESARVAMLDAAAVWERMADWEDKRTRSS